jgi:hypothetical protein
MEQPLVAHSFPPAKVVPPEPLPSVTPIRTALDYQPQVPDGRDEDTERTGSLKGTLSRLLHPEKKQKRQERRAPRINAPRLVAYYYAGGPSAPHEIKNISTLGFYMVTDERWMPGTVIRVTLQSLDSNGNFPDSVTVFSRVVYWGADGGGFEFVYPAAVA